MLYAWSALCSNYSLTGLNDSYDTIPSVLHFPIKSSLADPHAAKKAKLSQPVENATVFSMVTSRNYTSIDQFVKDVDSAVKGVVKELGFDTNSDASPQPVLAGTQKQAQIARATMFKKRLDELLSREMVIRPKAIPAPGELQDCVEEEMKGGGLSGPSALGNELSSHRQVLTLFGSAPNARQLFSSFQQPSTVGPGGLLEPISEWGFPNGIGTTRIVPVHSLENKSIPTLGELLPQPASLAQLNPPRQSKHTATRSASVSWVNAAEVSNPSRPYRRDSYATQSLTTGQWLKYNVAPTPSQLASPEAKRKQRDRALSFGETQPTIPQETLDAHHQKKEDALFRSVYSSFAPSRDTTGATVSQDTKDRLWWSKSGETMYKATFYPPLPDGSEKNEAWNQEYIGDDQMESSDGQIDSFKEAVACWQPDENPPQPEEPKGATTEPPETSDDVDDILKEISELLETLNSYQRVRNLSLSNTARTPSGQGSTSSGTPTSPSPAEFDMYNILKSQLTIMVSSLPPWALARINGEKLNALNVSSRIQVEGTNYKGTMEDNEAAAKANKIGTPVTGYPRTVPASVPARTGYPGTTAPPYQRSNYAPQTATRPTANPSAYLPNQQYSARPASASQYLGTSHSAYTPRPATTSTDRYAYPSGQQYNQPVQPTAGYVNGTRSYPNQTASYYSTQYTPTHASSTQTQRAAQPVYQQRAADSIAYNYPPGHKAGSPQQANPAYNPGQRSYAGINATPSQARSNHYPGSSASYSQSPSSTANGSGSNMAGFRSANDQAAFMNRQKAQLDDYRQSTMTPQPGSRTATPVQNGITAGQGQ